MSIDQEPSYPITDKNDIELIRMYMSEYVRHTFSNHLLYFNLTYCATSNRLCENL